MSELDRFVELLGKSLDSIHDQIPEAASEARWAISSMKLAVSEAWAAMIEPPPSASN